MPYIKKERRESLNQLIDDLVTQLDDISSVAGDFNYTITRILASGFGLDKDPSYSKINEIMGILECIKFEMYRRVASEYEKDKIIENGDVLEYELFDKRKAT